MTYSIELIERELNFINDRILLIRKGEVNDKINLSLKDALVMKEDFIKALKILKNI